MRTDFIPHIALRAQSELYSLLHSPTLGEGVGVKGGNQSQALSHCQRYPVLSRFSAAGVALADVGIDLVMLPLSGLENLILCTLNLLGLLLKAFNPKRFLAKQELLTNQHLDLLAARERADVGASVEASSGEAGTASAPVKKDQPSSLGVEREDLEESEGLRIYFKDVSFKDASFKDAMVCLEVACKTLAYTPFAILLLPLKATYRVLDHFIWPDKAEKFFY